jgi:hypothetical protein
MGSKKGLPISWTSFHIHLYVPLVPTDEEIDIFGLSQLHSIAEMAQDTSKRPVTYRSSWLKMDNRMVKV